MEPYKPNLKKHLRFLPFLLGTGLLLLAAGSFSFGNRRETVTTYSMGSYVQQTVYGACRKEGAAAAAEAVANLDKLLSWRVGESDVSRLNAGAGEGDIPIDPRTWETLHTSLSVCRESAGAFDVTIGPVSRLWDFDENPRLPDKGEIESALKQVGYASLSLPSADMAALEKAGACLDLGAVGKGAACDQAVRAYAAAGVDRAVVAVGGSVAVYGKKPGGTPWNIAVRDPKGQGALGTLAVREGFVSTSGSYEKTFSQGGKTYHHLLDPRTGYPAESGLVSVTVWSGEGVLSDALSTACFVMGLENALPLLEKFEAQAVFVTEDDIVLVTEGLRESFALENENYRLG